MVSKSNKLLIGSFVSMNKADKYLLGSLKEALACDENCLMFYNGSPQTINRPNINEININEFQTKCNENNIKLVNIIVHSPYIINLATNEIAKKEFTFNILLNEVERTHKIGSKYIVVHPGNATNGMERSIAIKNVADMINKINKINKNVCLCLETMSGKGNEIGVTFSELKQIILLVDNKELIGICLDTCHTWDYGYD
jgi:deoxyribonuclease-4